ncbi:uncharacterized protein C8Q71DRAFT_518734 [Rhodofomes roseus]|uniref:Cyclin N-terminal domain-containing protein n=1 Tax=Rhodofomes roseus TaxID=34475 RepID=A0ABQ8KJT3_9APHY|nr:uncharacterized protein C8Q71DRAFT_518734 [Rhodofomes roseus]KAH9838229.1 hypothetical protein C8Q71DRAFT_518734 [Rhodofomes roseus]
MRVGLHARSSGALRTARNTAVMTNRGCEHCPWKWKWKWSILHTTARGCMRSYRPSRRHFVWPPVQYRHIEPTVHGAWEPLCAIALHFKCSPRAHEAGILLSEIDARCSPLAPGAHIAAPMCLVDYVRRRFHHLRHRDRIMSPIIYTMAALKLRFDHLTDRFQFSVALCCAVAMVTGTQPRGHTTLCVARGRRAQQCPCSLRYIRALREGRRTHHPLRPHSNTHSQ